ncbi:MAG: Histidine kinase-, DNA gyrase B-, and HSP90-likeATPase [Candidatus Argoarchaeum ethanivorans]|uniref:Histidine kinase-, DNA gyrase B-, and HSP90-likeATPase n=1 Tax=Candidatus Argoarchaeum ethanivorans TaxID=2608793 RepID=A0A812A141_9EURY|nr:MAG: Histidine kinase-, DNA gyrase B-, and HSP90-likeATPase [Candidatus Argoarchaeum ethanivorans]
MAQKRINKSKFKAGMYLLETLSSGMYNQPLSIYREYVQNAVDSIDKSRSYNSILKVDITLDPFKSTIIISDNGEGIKSGKAQEILSNIGLSDKVNDNYRGFRGIGRLGGIAFSEKVTFKTKAKGEKKESVQEWDCSKLKRIISDSTNSTMSLRQLFTETTNFFQKRVSKVAGSYFKIILEGVSSYRNDLFDIEKVRNYLSEVAPLPFDREQFSFGLEVDDFLEKNLNLYGKYNVFINGEQIFKPYQDQVRITKMGTDLIESVELFDIYIDGDQMGFGWYGKRKNLLGAINRSTKVSGIRIRRGNILIGDAHLMDACFRESRFNSYTIGEIHINTPNLIPNSRRDDFIDNDYKAKFYNEVERKLGFPLSKGIRIKSKLNSEIVKKKKNFKEDNTEEICSFEKCQKYELREGQLEKSEIIGNIGKCEELLRLINKCVKCKNNAICKEGLVVLNALRKN